eukprot:scaffold100129_cov22-Cyclotella_meneghiniana.AAC.2
MSTYGKDCTPVKNGFAGLINTEHLGCCPYFDGFVGRLRLKSCHKTWQSLRVPCFRCHFSIVTSSCVDSINNVVPRQSSDCWLAAGAKTPMVP